MSKINSVLMVNLNSLSQKNFLQNFCNLQISVTNSETNSEIEAPKRDEKVFKLHNDLGGFEMKCVSFDSLPTLFPQKRGSKKKRKKKRKIKFKNLKDHNRKFYERLFCRFPEGMSDPKRIKSSARFRTKSEMQFESNVREFIMNNNEVISRESLLLSDEELLLHDYPIKKYDIKIFENNKSDDEVKESAVRMVGLDCEMCSTRIGLEVTRTTLVDENNKVFYDKLSVPKNTILNYNTKYSGITKETLEGVTTQLEEIQKDLCSVLRPTDILVGHSLNNDLHCLQMEHNKVIDTSVLFPHEKQFPYKKSLKELAKKYLYRKIQKGEIQKTGSKEDFKGHDSAEDARACLDLVKLKLRVGKNKEMPVQEYKIGKKNRNIFKRICIEKDLNSVIVDNYNMVKLVGKSIEDDDGVELIHCDNAESCCERTKRVLERNKDKLVWCGLDSLSRHVLPKKKKKKKGEINEDEKKWEEESIQELKDHVKALLKTAKINTLIIFLSPHGYIKRKIDINKPFKVQEEDFSIKLEIEQTPTNPFENGFVSFIVKKNEFQ